LTVVNSEQLVELRQRLADEVLVAVQHGAERDVLDDFARFADRLDARLDRAEVDRRPSVQRRQEIASQRRPSARVN
jgi:hypothetical protein